MKAKGFGGSVGGIPIRGGVVNIDSADASTIINATSGLIRTTANAGIKLGLAVGILALLLDGLSTEHSSGIPILSLAQIHTLNRNFLGICENEAFECVCEGEKLTIPIRTINKIGTNFWFGNSLKLDISLIDGSLYEDCVPKTKHLSFVTILGKQKLILAEGMSIEGATVDDINALRQRLVFALENNLEKIIDTIGKEAFEKFFILEKKY